MRRAFRIPIAAGFLLFGAQAALAEPTERTALWEWEDVPKVVAIGDLHGGYDKLLELLRSADLIDSSHAWRGGETQLVVAGDFLDRGPAERPILDLLRSLQVESEAAGGRVHVLLGNHEVMNLLRDFRYVNPVSFRDFDDLEDEDEREEAWVDSLNSHGASRATLNQQVNSFKKHYPEGYFGRMRAFDVGGEYGDWLLRLPTIVRINGIVYLHGGLTEEFAGLGVDGINLRVQETLSRHLAARTILEKAGVVRPGMLFTDILSAVQRKLKEKRSGLSQEERLAGQTVLATAQDPILRSKGPLWYRGNSFEDERIERDNLERSLELVGATAMVVAHSFTGGNRITSRFHGQLFRLDHGILQSEKPLALVVDRSDVLVLDSTTRKTSKPVRELPTGIRKPPEMSEISSGDLEKFLKSAPVVDSRALGRGSTRPQLVVLEEDGKEWRALFKTVENGADRYEHEVAAYRLGRRLGLGLVPATVIREIGGRKGSLQWWVEGAVDLEAAKSYGLTFQQSETTDHELAQGKVFDALIGNHARKPSDIVCLTNGERVFLIDHSRAFSESPDLDPDDGASLTPDLAQALRSLDRKSLGKELGDLLSERQIEALLERRDKILAAPPAKRQTKAD